MFKPTQTESCIYPSGVCSLSNHPPKNYFLRRARTGSLGGRRCEQRSPADKSSSSRECSKQRNTSTPGKEAILAGMFPVGTSSTISLLCSHSLVCPSSVSYIFVFFSLACLCFSSSFLLASMKYAFPPGFWRCQSNR